MIHPSTPKTSQDLGKHLGNYYNDNDPYATQWRRNLIAAGQIAPGDVDERSIKEAWHDPGVPTRS